MQATQTSRSLSSSRPSRLTQLRDESKKNRGAQRLQDTMNDSMNETIRGFEKLYTQGIVQAHPVSQSPLLPNPSETDQTGRPSVYKRILDTIGEQQSQASHLDKLQSRRSNSKRRHGTTNPMEASLDVQLGPSLLLQRNNCIDFSAASSLNPSRVLNLDQPIADLGSGRVQATVLESQRLNSHRAQGRRIIDPAEIKAQPLPVEARILHTRVNSEFALIPEREKLARGSLKGVAALGIIKEKDNPVQANSKNTGCNSSRQFERTHSRNNNVKENRLPTHTDSKDLASAKTVKPQQQHQGNQPLAVPSQLQAKLERFSRQVAKLAANFEVVSAALNSRPGEETKTFEKDVKRNLRDMEKMVKLFIDSTSHY